MQANARDRGGMVRLGGWLRLAALALGLGIPAILAHTLHRQHGQEISEAETRAANTARALEQHAARTFEVTDTYLRAVVALVGAPASRLTAEGIHAALREHFLRSTSNNIIVVDRQGRAVVDANAFPTRAFDVSDHDYFRILRDRPDGSFTVGKPILGRLSGKPVLPVARRIEGPDGSFAGIVVAMLDAEAFQSVYGTIDNGPDATLNLWRLDGTLLVRSPRMPEAVGRNFSGGDNYRRHVPTRDVRPFWSASLTDGVERVIALGFVDGYPVYVGAAISRADALAGWRRSAAGQASVGGGLTLVLVTALLLLAHEVERRREADAHIRASEERYRLLAENTSDMIVFKPTMHGRRGYVSPAVRTILGWEPDAYAALASSEIIHPEEMADVVAVYGALSPECPQVTHVHRLRHKDGHYVWIESVFNLVAGEAGDRTVVVSGRDVTARRAADAALRESEARLRLVSGATTDMITHMDLSGRRLYVSPASLDLLGYDPSELIDTSPQETIHPEDAAGLATLLDHLREGRCERGINVNRLRHRDGHWVWVEASLRRLQDATGRATGFVASVRNIGSRREAEEALRDSEARYRMLAENSSDVITRLSLDFQRTYVSPSCQRLFGYEPEQMLGEKPSATIHLDDATMVRDAARQLVAGRVLTDQTVTTYRAKHRFGHWIWIEATLNLARDSSGVPDSIVCVLRDAGARKADEATLVRARETAEAAQAKAEEADRAKGEFLATMSHEIRTPLNAIKGFNELLADDEDLSAGQRRYVERVHGACRLLTAVVDDILDYARIEAGGVALEAAPFAPWALVADTTAMVRGLAEAKGLDLSAQISPELPPWLAGDATRLRQVLLNLLNNAIKFTPNGVVTVAVDYTNTEGDARLWVAVRDTGIGIPAVVQARLFSRFSQADGSTTRRFGGSGLGLAICKGLVEAMGGEIGLTSEAGAGSTFWFAVPLAQTDAPCSLPHQAPRRTMPSVASGGSCRRLLLVDDEETNQVIGRAVLEREGYEVDLAQTGLEAFGAVLAKSYDLVLMDVQMPEMDGLTATRAIRALAHPARSLPIVAMTANVMPQQVAQFREAGMDDHIGKPFEREQLFAVIERWIGRRTGEMEVERLTIETEQHAIER